MFVVSLKSKLLKEYLNTILGKGPDEPITDEDLKGISTLKLNKDMLSDNAFQDLVFFENLQSLSLTGVDIGDKEIAILNRLKKVSTLSIRNSKIDFSKIEYLNGSLKNLIFDNCEGINIEKFTSSKLLSKITIVNCKNINLNGISNFENLEEINLPNNEQLTNEDIKNIWDVKSLKNVNLDGSNNISDYNHGGINISHSTKYEPGELIDWNGDSSEHRAVTLSSLSNFSPDQLGELSGLDIHVTADDMELLKTEKGRQLVTFLQKNNSFDLLLNTTADMSMKDMESLNSICKFSTVHVQTGWPVTQNMGYSYQTYKAIKEEIMDIIKGIDPNLSETQKYKIVRERITKRISYDYTALQAAPGEKDYYSSRNLENGLLNHTCVCAGYADIFKNVLAELGIKATYVEGRTNKGELHAWNQVYLMGDDGKRHWYNDDITFDAVGKNKFANSLVDDVTFSKTHRCIPGRTEGRRKYACSAPAPAAVRAARNLTGHEESMR